MKTIIVIYTDRVLTDSKAIGRLKKYSFNTEADVQVGDLISSPEYTTKMQVVRILDESFKYYHSVTGDMSNTYLSTLQWDIRTLIIRDDAEQNSIYGKIVNR